MTQLLVYSVVTNILIHARIVLCQDTIVRTTSSSYTAPAKILDKPKQGTVAVTITPSRPLRPPGICGKDNNAEGGRNLARESISGASKITTFGSTARDNYRGKRGNEATKSAAVAPSVAVVVGAAISAEGVSEDRSGRRRRVEEHKAGTSRKQGGMARRPGADNRGNVGERSVQGHVQSNTVTSSGQVTVPAEKRVHRVRAENTRRVCGSGSSQWMSELSGSKGGRNPWLTQVDANSSMWMSQDAAVGNDQRMTRGLQANGSTTQNAEDVGGLQSLYREVLHETTTQHIDGADVGMDDYPFAQQLDDNFVGQKPDAVRDDQACRDILILKHR